MLMHEMKIYDVNTCVNFFQCRNWTFQSRN